MVDRKEQISFSARNEYLPGLILEQCVQLRALLATSLALQMELLAHFTGDDPKLTRQDYVGRLEEFSLQFAQEVQASIAAQTPPETP